MNTDFMNIPIPAVEQLQKRQEERELLMDSTKINLDSTAEKVAKHIYDEIIAYQNSLSDPMM